MAISRWQDRGVADRTDSNPFNAKTIIWVIVAGLLAFAGFLFLTAYAPKWDRGGNGGTNILSKSGVGFSGLYAFEIIGGERMGAQRAADGITDHGDIAITKPILAACPGDERGDIVSQCTLAKRDRAALDC